MTPFFVPRSSNSASRLGALKFRPLTFDAMIVPIVRLTRGGHAFLVFAPPIFTGEDPGRRVELTSIRCGGFNSYFLFGILIQNSCVLEGVVPAAE